jgi:hypothetical protein
MEGVGKSGPIVGNYEKYYSESLEKGLQYQDFVCSELYRRGVPVVGFSSKKYQNKHGENLSGIEIKFDDRLKETGNVYIEIAEKSHPNNPYFVPSGIYRSDNSWLYAIGNYEVIYIFAKNTLVRLHAQAVKRGYRTIKIPTSRGFLLSIPETEKYAAYTIRIKNNGYEQGELEYDPNK